MGKWRERKRKKGQKALPLAGSNSTHTDQLRLSPLDKGQVKRGNRIEIREFDDKNIFYHWVKTQRKVLGRKFCIC